MIIIQREPTRYFQFDSDRFQFDKFKDAIEYLHLFVRTSPSRLWNFEEDNGNGYDALNFIGKSVAYFNENIDYDIFTQNEFDEIFSILLDFFYMHRNEINFNLGVNVFESDFSILMNENKMSKARIFVKLSIAVSLSKRLSLPLLLLT